MRQIKPDLVMLRISAYGQTGPKKGEPGFARIAHAFAGLSFLAGDPEGPPVVPGSTSLADYISGMWGAIGVLLALRARDRHGMGQYIDIGLYESVFRLLDEIAPAYARYGFVRTRMGADTVNVVPHSHYRTKSGEWVAIACTNDRMFERLADVVGRAELARSPDYATSVARVKRRDVVNKMVADWVLKYTIDEVLAKCAAGGVPCGPVYSIADIFADPQYAARGNLMKVQDARLGELVLPSSMPRLSKTPAEFRHVGRPLGADNQRVYEELLELNLDEIRELKAARVI